MKFKKLTAVLVVVLSIAFIAGCSLTGGGDKKNVENGGNDSGTPPVNPQPTKEQVEVTLYFSDDQATYLKSEQRTVEKGGKPMAELLISELIKGPDDKSLSKTIPGEAKLISLEIADGVAFVNFSKEMKTKHWGGSAGETMTVQSVVHTLVQLPEIKEVQFLIEGEKEEAIWGHGYTAEPVGPAKDIIAK